jgi:hypothetical protein
MAATNDAIKEALGFLGTVPIEPYVKELATSGELPSLAVALCTARYDDCAQVLRAALERAAAGALIDREDERLFFRALFIIGGRRDPSGFEPLLRLLRRPPDEVEYLLGDANPGHLPRIAAGMFNGDADALFDAIMDLRLEDFTRDSLLGAATFLTWEGRVDRERMIAFLRRFEAERLAPDEDMTWFGWSQAVALLGLRELEAAVLAAWNRGSMPQKMFEHDRFMEDLERAERAPNDIERFEDAYLGYIEDVLVALQDWILDDHFVDDDEDDVPDIDVLDDLGKPLSPPGQPAFNPWRHVGRNDPCPCGSGKKAKRCCLAT